MSLTPAGTVGEIDCADYEEQSSELTFNLTSSSEKRITMSFDTEGEYYVDADDYQVCFQSDTAFLDRNGDTDEPGSAPRMRDRLLFVRLRASGAAVRRGPQRGRKLRLPDVPGAWRRPESSHLSA